MKMFGFEYITRTGTDGKLQNYIAKNQTKVILRQTNVKN